MILCYTYRSVTYPIIIEKASLVSRWKKVKRLTATHYEERVSKREDSIKSFPLKLGQSHGRECMTIVKFKGDGGYWENKVL